MRQSTAEANTSGSMTDARTPESLSTTLLAWYDKHRRQLPWREHPTPYRVLLSELMLQQTRVETVKPYFARFLDRWPTLEDLAAAAEDEVLTEWAGLGYYSRARNLHRAARQAVGQGGLPSDVAGLRALPGIGPYTAGAIASIAFGIRTPLVDGNVERVLCRLDDVHADPRSTAGKKALWARATALVPEARPGDFNQALMELGATVCTPRSPRCEACPWQAVCRSRAAGTQLQLPRIVKKTKVKAMRGVAGLLVDEGRVLLGRRSAKGLLGGLWEPLTVTLEARQKATPALLAAFEATGHIVRIDDLLGEVRHVFTHRRLTQQVYRVSLVGRCRPEGSHYDEVRAVELGQVDALGLSRLAEKCLALGGVVPGQLSLGLAASPSSDTHGDTAADAG